MSDSRITYETWRAEGEKLFGSDMKLWKWVCPLCKTEQDKALFEQHTDLDDDRIRKVITGNCIGRHARRGEDGKPAVGCDYTSGGLLDFTPLKVFHDGRWYSMFGFAGGREMPSDIIDTYQGLQVLIEATGKADNIAWPDWVPEKIRKDVHNFWSCFGRRPKDYFDSYRANLTPDFGAESDFRVGYGKEARSVRGRYVHAWSNVGRVVLPDGSEEGTSI